MEFASENNIILLMKILCMLMKQRKLFALQYLNKLLSTEFKVYLA